MFKTTSLFIKVVCLNNTYNLNLVSSAYNSFDFFICSFGVIPHVQNVGHSAFETP